MGSIRTIRLLKHLERRERINLERGMTEDEIREAEKLFGVKFPIELKKVYEKAVPVGGGFCDWSDFSPENVEGIRGYMQAVKQEFLDSFEDVYWPDEYVERGLDKDKETFEKMLMAAPNLMPLFGSRCMVSGIDNGPVISVVGTDIIYFGLNLYKGIKIQYSNSERHLHYKDIKTKIPFWSEMIEI